VTDLIARQGGVSDLPRAPRPVPVDDTALPRFTLLGPVQVRTDDRDHTPTAPKLRQLLALLMMRSGHTLHPEAIVHELWSREAPPRNVRSCVQTLVYQLRRCLDDAGPAASGRHVLAVRPPGYVLRVQPHQLDVVVFHELVRQGQEAFHARQFEHAARLLRAGLGLWAGDPMANVRCGPVLSSYALDLQEHRRNARYLRIQADIEAGRAEQLIGELRALVASDPLDEGAHAQLMQVLGRVGRRSEALALYRPLRERLIDELGLEPCEIVEQRHREVLRAGLTVR
jgi:DNA-binding SARP family transcriptional activator